jgi:hypothetical protein
MITNEKQYRSARAAIDRFGAEIADLRNVHDSVHPSLRRAQIAGLESQLAELGDEVQEYEHLQSGAVTSFEAEGLADPALRGGALPLGQSGALGRDCSGPRHHGQGKRTAAHSASEGDGA